MRVESLDSDQMTVHIVKIGPLLTGDVRLAVESADSASCNVLWDEDIQVPYLPGFLSKPVGAAARKAFEVSIDRMAKHAKQRV